MKLLMCPPDFFGIEYEINPWMDINIDADLNRAKKQWQGLYDVLTKDIGVCVEIITPMKGSPDMVFTANGGIIKGNVFISANFRYKERKEEETYFIKWFEAAGFDVTRPPGNVVFEGEGDMLSSGNSYFGGYRFRSDITSHKWVGDFLGVEVLSLELIDPRFYHLDTCFCPLPGGELIYFPGAFDSYAISVIDSVFDKSKQIQVNKKEAGLFACNAVAFEDRVVTNAGCDELKGDLESHGYKVFQTDLSEFIKSGGSAKCLTLWI